MLLYLLDDKWLNDILLMGCLNYEIFPPDDFRFRRLFYCLFFNFINDDQIDIDTDLMFGFLI